MKLLRSLGIALVALLALRLLSDFLWPLFVPLLVAGMLLGLAVLILRGWRH